MSLTIQQVLRSSADSFLGHSRFPLHVWQAVRRLRDCRTAALGFHARRCPNGHVEQVCYNSCKHRCCPQCGWLQTERWLEVEKARLLGCPHFHVVFTIPSCLRAVWRYNRVVFGNLLFQAAAESLLQLLADPKYLGGKPGLLLAQHTWNKQLGLHPHIHALVTSGGLDPRGQWRGTRRRWLLPQKVLTAKFQGKLRALLGQALASGRLQRPTGSTEARLRGLLNRLGRGHVNVKILERYDHGQGVVTYLAKYLRGGPMSNRRLGAYQDGVVTFRYPDRRSPPRSDRPQMKWAQLPVLTFLQRYFQHVPPKHFQMVRRYGLYANNQREALNVARAACGQAAWEKPKRPSWAELLDRVGCGQPGRCPVCQAELVCERAVASPIRSPPTPQPTNLPITVPA